jgi:NAD+ kinase
MKNITIIYDKNQKSKNIKNFIKKNIKENPFGKNKLIIVIGGDGFMLETLKKNNDSNHLFYGINSGSGLTG